LFTYSLISAFCWWPNLENDIQKHVSRIHSHVTVVLYAFPSLLFNTYYTYVHTYRRLDVILYISRDQTYSHAIFSRKNMFGKNTFRTKRRLAAELQLNAVYGEHNNFTDDNRSRPGFRVHGTMYIVCSLNSPDARTRTRMN